MVFICRLNLSLEIQNKLINIIGKDLILNDIISETKDSKLFSIMADEVTSHNIEVLNIRDQGYDE